ncbi:S1 family peptidase [Streptomyces sp. HSW2009]|uniref:S1 family peptidase n=1 Tax=Streptomyces sp. HSW2009 TaxID=3142890 RepID=UPI0032EAF9CD
MRYPPVLARLSRPLWVAVLLAVLALLVAGAPAATAADRQTVVMGGSTIYSSNGKSCMVGFNADKGHDPYGIVPGYCVQAVGTQWFADRERTIPIGTTVVAGYPHSGYGLIHYTNPDVSFPGQVRLGNGQTIDLAGAKNPVVGEQICQVGRVLGWTCGTVQQVNVSVAFPDGMVNGLFTSSACADPSNVGGAVVAGDKALGFIVGETGDCRVGGRTFYQPVIPVLAAHGLVLR